MQGINARQPCQGQILSHGHRVQQQAILVSEDGEMSFSVMNLDSTSASQIDVTEGTDVEVNALFATAL